MTISIDIEGPVFSQISFAHVVRCLALALDELGCDISIQATDSKSDGYKKVAQLENYDRILTFANKTPKNKIKILYNFPVNMNNRCRGYNFAIVSWETTSVPTEWIQELNKHSDQIWPISEFVSDVFVNGGADRSKTKVIPMGVDPRLFSPNTSPKNIETKKKFKFLHLGVAQERKGTPLLLRSYQKAFTKNDDVCLIIKSNGFGMIDRWISDFKKNPNHPEIIYLYEETPETELASYYTAADCFVYPVHAEGAGLPVLEALACGRPAIVPLWSGLTDFCTVNNSIPVKFKIVPLSKRYSTYSGRGPESWAEISEEDLIQQMRFAATNPDITRTKGDHAASYINKRFTWRNTALKALAHINEVVRDNEIAALIEDSSNIVQIPSQVEKKVEAPSSAHKIAIVANLASFSQAYMYAKASLDNLVSQKIGLISKTIRAKNAISCIDPGSLSPTTIIENCRSNNANIVEIHWDRFLVHENNLTTILRHLQNAGLHCVVHVHDEFESPKSLDFFYLANYWITSTLKTRNFLLSKGCPLTRLRYLPPLNIPLKLPNKNKTRQTFNIGHGNIVLLSPSYLNDQFSCLEIASQIKADITKMPHVKYLIGALDGTSEAVEAHIKTTAEAESFLGVLSGIRSEQKFLELIALADYIVLPNKSKTPAPQHPFLSLALNAGVTVVMDQSVIPNELDGILPLQAEPWEQMLANNSIPTGMSTIPDYIKMMESVYYSISNVVQRVHYQEVPKQVIEAAINVDEPIIFSEI